MRLIITLDDVPRHLVEGIISTVCDFGSCTSLVQLESEDAAPETFADMLKAARMRRERTRPA